MTDKQDSSAPNFPDLTRLSGEQAEERTAREGRAKEWVAANYDKWFSARKAACKTMYGTEPVIELLAEYAQAECSRLASRVEELENLIAKHSGSLNSADSASNTESSSTAKEIR